jgi:hypothetical protein
MIKSRSRHGRDEECMQGFGEKTRKKETNSVAVQPVFEPRMRTSTYTWIRDTRIWPDPVYVVVEAGVLDVLF